MPLAHTSARVLEFESLRELLRGYIRSPMLEERIVEYIAAPALGNRSGGLGAIALAVRLARHRAVAERRRARQVDRPQQPVVQPQMQHDGIVLREDLRPIPAIFMPWR